MAKKPERWAYKDDKGRVLFVDRGIGKKFATYYRKDNGSLKRFVSKHLPDVQGLAKAQHALDVYAADHNYERACLQCGCTDGAACPGGCNWVAPSLCSSCGHKAPYTPQAISIEERDARRTAAAVAPMVDLLITLANDIADGELADKAKVGLRLEEIADTLFLMPNAALGLYAAAHKTERAKARAAEIATGTKNGGGK